MKPYTGTPDFGRIKSSIRLFISLITLTVISIAAAGQQPRSSGKITGRIMDSALHKGVPYVTVALFRGSATAPQDGAFSDAAGNFTLESVSAGTYRIRIEAVGFRTVTISNLVVAAGKPQVNAGNIFISQTSTRLKSVLVEAQRPLVENRPDMLVYHADKDLTSIGGVATDVLKKVPEVSVDVDGNVELQGDANVRVLINGKPSSIFGNNLTEALQSIPASQIKDIEVITTPGAKYDAEGTAGIINIVLKDNTAHGINGEVILSAGSRLENGSFDFQVREGHFGIHASLSGNGNILSTSLSGLNRNSMDSLSDQTQLFQNGQSGFTRQGYMSQLGFDWDLSPHDNLSGSVGYDNFLHHSSGFTDQTETFALKDTSYAQALHRQVINNFNFNSLDWNLSYKKTFARKGQELDILYLTTKGSNGAYYLQNQFDQPGDLLASGAQSKNSGLDNETDLQIDYTQPLSATTELETGIKGIWQQLSSNSVYENLQLPSMNYIFDSSQSNDFTYSRNIYAGYASLNFQLSKKIQVRAGTRLEHTTAANMVSNGQQVVVPAYNTLVPSVIVSYALDSTHMFRLGYSGRIERPDFEDLNPFINASDPTNIYEGNPNLRPEKAKRIEMSYNILLKKGAVLDFTLFYHYNTDDMQPYTFLESTLKVGDSVYTNVAVTTRENVGDEQTIGLHVFGALPLTRNLNIRGNFALFDKYITNLIDPGNSNHGYDYRLNLNATYQFPANLVGEVFCNYRSSRTEAQGKQPSFTTYSIALRKLFWQKKASIALTTTNPFNNYVYMPTTLAGQGFTLSSYRKIPFRSFGISFSYQFGKLQFGDKKKPDTGGGDVPEEN